MANPRSPTIGFIVIVKKYRTSDTGGDLGFTSPQSRVGEIRCVVLKPIFHMGVGQPQEIHLDMENPAFLDHSESFS